jgi:hypothetical protein
MNMSGMTTKLITNAHTAIPMGEGVSQQLADRKPEAQPE